MKQQELITPFSTRQYMYSKDFEIYYYSNRPGEPVAPHTHDYYEFYFFLEGNVNIVINNDPIHVKPGDLLIIPPGISHYPEFLDSSTAYRRFVLWISTDYCNKLIDASLDYGYILQLVSTTGKYLVENDVVTFNELQGRLFSIADEVKGRRFGRDAKISLEVNDLLIILNRIVHDKNYSGRESGSRRLSESVAEYIDLHLEEDLSLDKFEQEFYVSKYHISHTFKEDMGITIHKFIQMKRLDAARSAIQTGIPVTNVCSLYGFGDYSSFYRAYKKTYGETPAETVKKSMSE